MRHTFIALLLIAFCNIYANDTLTRAQVYNFNVGDTFDYLNYSYQQNPFGAGYYATTYSRFVVSDISWSVDSLTKVIVHQRISPAPIVFDTLTLDSLNGYEVILDTVWYNQNLGPDTFIITSAPYFGKTTNYITFFCCAPGWEEILFAQGLGRVVDRTWGGVLSNHYEDSTTLINYSGSNGTFGTPYTSFPTAVNDLSPSNQKLNIFPTLNNGVFTVETPDDMPLPLNFSVYDVQGKKVKQLTLSDKKTTVELPGVSKGLYVWKAISSEKFIGAGKVVVE